MKAKYDDNLQMASLLRNSLQFSTWIIGIEAPILRLTYANDLRCWSTVKQPITYLTLDSSCHMNLPAFFSPGVHHLISQRYRQQSDGCSWHGSLSGNRQLVNRIMSGRLPSTGESHTPISTTAALTNCSIPTYSWYSTVTSAIQNTWWLMSRKPSRKGKIVIAARRSGSF